MCQSWVSLEWSSLVSFHEYYTLSDKFPWISLLIPHIWKYHQTSWVWSSQVSGYKGLKSGDIFIKHLIFLCDAVFTWVQSLFMWKYKHEYNMYENMRNRIRSLSPLEIQQSSGSAPNHHHDGVYFFMIEDSSRIMLWKKEKTLNNEWFLIQA